MFFSFHKEDIAPLCSHTALMPHCCTYAQRHALRAAQSVYYTKCRKEFQNTATLNSSLSFERGFAHFYPCGTAGRHTLWQASPRCTEVDRRNTPPQRDAADEVGEATGRHRRRRLNAKGVYTASGARMATARA